VVTTVSVAESTLFYFGRLSAIPAILAADHFDTSAMVCQLARRVCSEGEESFLARRNSPDFRPRMVTPDLIRTCADRRAAVGRVRVSVPDRVLLTLGRNLAIIFPE
jgi:hypothetical protein